MSRSREGRYRVAIFACGVLSILIARAYRNLDLFFPANRHSWTAVFWTLLITGIVNLALAMAPASWMHRILGNSEAHGLRLPFRMLAGFFVASYAVVSALSLLRPGTVISPLAVYTICPSCVLTITVDPSTVVSLLVLAPISAAIHGSVGALIGLVVGVFHR